MFEGFCRNWGERRLALALLAFVCGCTDADIFRCTVGTPSKIGGQYVCVGADAGGDASMDAGADASSDAATDASSGSDGGWPTCAQTLTRTECNPSAPACGSGETCLLWWGRYFCRKPCTLDSDCASVHAASRCIAFESGTLGCSSPCQPGDDTTCATNESCGYNPDPNRGSPYVFTECRPLLAQGAPFSTCPPANTTLCAANSTCWYSNDAANTSGTSEPRCLVQCRIGHNEDCASISGTSCSGWPAAGLCGETFGLCQF